MAHEKLIYNGLILKGTLGDGTGDSMLTVSAAGVVKKVPAVSSGLSTTLSSGNIYVGNVSNVATSVTPSGDVTISNTGVTAIAPGVIVNADISGSAAIAFSKLAALTASKATVTNGSGVITTSATTATEIGYVSGVTSAIQTQLNNKQATVTGAATTITSANLTPNFALISSPTGKVSVSGISTTILNYLTSVTSDVQNQINTVIAGSQTSALLQAPTGSEDGYAITWDSGNSQFNLTPISAAGVPNGGTTGQYLIKNSNSDQDTAWSTFVLADVTDIFVTADEVNSLNGLDTANVGATQFNYLSGLSGNVQTQIDDKLADSLAYNAIFIGNASNMVSQLAPGTNGQVLTIVGAAPSWQTPTPPGNVSGVAPSVDNAVARWNGTTADSIQNSLVIISDTGDVSGVATLTATDISTATTIGSAYIYRASGTDVAVGDGGTGISSYTTGDILYASGATTLSKLPAGTNGYVLTSNGPGVAPSWQAGGGGGGAVSSVSGTTNRISASPTTGNVIVDIDAAYVGQTSITTLGTITTGTWSATTIGVAKGGTNITSYAVGDLIYASGATTLSKLADVATGNALISGGVTTAPLWGKIGLTTHVSGVLPVANGGTALSSMGSAYQFLRVNAGASALEYTTLSGTANRISVATGDTIDIDAAYIGQASITTLGTIATGTWQGTSISTTYTDAKIKTVTGTTNRLTIGGTSTDPTFDISTSYVGQATITTLGTITTGVWNGTKIGLAYGGTNADLSATGGSGNYLKQSSAGAAITVGTIPASDIGSGAALTKTDDTNVTLTLGGSPTSALLAATSLTLGWTGTLAAGRLNANVVQAITNDTNVTGSISTQNLTLGWTGTLAYSRFSDGAGLSVVGRSANTSGVQADITAGANFNILRRSGTAIGFGSIDLSQAGAVGSSILALSNGGTNTDLSATGGTGQYLKQSSLGGSVSVGTISSSDITTSLGYTPGPKVVQLAISDEITALSTGTAKITFRMPYAMTLSSIRASLSTAQTSGSIFTVDVKKNGTTVFSTKITIDNTEKTSLTAAIPPVLSTTSISDDDEMTVDIVQIGDGTAKGLKVAMIGS